MARHFVVGVSTGRTTKKVTRYFVTDADSDDISSRPVAAEFPVSEAYTREIQEERAVAFADYMNKLEEAKKVAYEQVHLVDVLSRP